MGGQGRNCLIDNFIRLTWTHRVGSIGTRRGEGAKEKSKKQGLPNLNYYDYTNTKKHTLNERTKHKVTFEDLRQGTTVWRGALQSAEQGDCLCITPHLTGGRVQAGRARITCRAKKARFPMSIYQSLPQAKSCCNASRRRQDSWEATTQRVGLYRWNSTENYSKLIAIQTGLG